MQVMVRMIYQGRAMGTFKVLRQTLQKNHLPATPCALSQLIAVCFIPELYLSSVHSSDSLLSPFPSILVQILRARIVYPLLSDRKQAVTLW